MKRILTLALAAILVVAFAIPTFAAPKIELVGGAVKTHVTIGGILGEQEGPVFGALKFKLSADNFVFNVTTAYNVPTIYGDTWNPLGFLAIVNYNFALDLPFMTISGMYDDYSASFGYHGGHEVRLASNESFQEALGFNWAVFYNDDELTGPFGSLHGKLGIPVGEAFVGNLEYTYEEDVWIDANADSIVDLGEEHDVHLGKLDFTYNVSDDLTFNLVAAKNITNATNDFLFATTVNFPIVEGWAGGFYAQYAMAGFIADTDYSSGMGWWNGYCGDSMEAIIDVTYANENSHAQFAVIYSDDSDFATVGSLTGHLEYVSDGSTSLWSSNVRRANYAGKADGWNRGWNTQYKWVRDNKANEFAARLTPTYNLGTNAYGFTGYAMFAPDVVPVVLTLEGNYKSDGTWYVRNWVGVRVNPDIHLALYDRYDSAGAQFELDAALVYNKDSVTASITGTNLITAWGLDLFVGISF